MATGDTSGQLSLFQIVDKDTITPFLQVKHHSQSVTKVDFHYDGNIIGTISDDETC